MLIGREKEQKVLLDAYNSDESKFIAIYGRRRVGKTYLVNTLFNSKFVFSHSGVADESKDMQLKYFKESLIKYGYDCLDIDEWNVAFRYLRELVEKSKLKKKVIFLDELSWISTINSGFLTAFEYFWNSWACGRNDILLIVSSSTASWLLDNIIHNVGGLYNRLSYHMHLEPFTLSECLEYLLSRGFKYTHQMIVELYMCLGGIPYYYSLLDKNISVSQNIDKLFFNNNALLKNEFEYLYHSLFKNAELYIKIISTLNDKKIGLTRDEICKKLNITSNGTLTKKLSDLESCGFIRKYVKFQNKNKDALYQLIDNFSLFYFKFLKDANYQDNYWTINMYSTKLNVWRGLAYELVCLQHIENIKFKLGISGVSTNVCSWFCKENEDEGYFGSQIDLLIVRSDKVIHLCEIKYSKGKYIINKETYNNILNKISDLSLFVKSKYTILLTFVTSEGIQNNSYSNDISKVITSDDLFLKLE